MPSDTSGGAGVLLESLLCFSAHTNARKLLMPEDKAGSLGALHGIRFLSMTWIIFGHTYFFIEHVQPFRTKLLYAPTLSGTGCSVRMITGLLYTNSALRRHGTAVALLSSLRMGGSFIERESGFCARAMPTPRMDKSALVCSERVRVCR